MFLIKTIKALFNSVIKLLNGLENRTRRVVVGYVSFMLVITICVSIMSVCNLTYAVGVSVNGQKCGYVVSVEDANKAINNISKALNTNDDHIKPSVDYSHTIVAANNIITAEELANNMKELGDICEKIWCVVINDEPIAKTDSAESAWQLLSAEKGNHAFYHKVEVKECYLTEQVAKKLLSLNELRDATIKTEIEYDVTESDTVESIATKFNLSESNVPSLVIGETIKFKANLSALAVEMVFETEVKSFVSGYQNGNEAGYNITAVKERYIGNVKVSTQKVDLGFIPKYANKPVATKVVNAGNKGFCWPVDTGYKQYISSFWGDDRSHKGYDVAAKTGTPILSAKSGRVVGVNSLGEAYGIHFVIDHGNGIKTLYAHCSKLYVTEGDVVERGEVVALIGTTGRVTGPHLHFEVFKNGARVDPMAYIGKR